MRQRAAMGDEEQVMPKPSRKFRVQVALVGMLVTFVLSTATILFIQAHGCRLFLYEARGVVR
jgi:hypothetical protein